MAGRIRTVKPELMEDAVTAGLSHSAFRLFVGMILLADDHGNLRAAPRWLTGQVFHGCDNDKPIASLLAELGERLVTFYDVDGQHYAHIRGWAKHQRIDNAGEPRVPLHPGWSWRTEHYNDGKRARSRVVLFRSEPAAASSLASPDLPSVAAASSNDSIDLPSAATAGSRSPITITIPKGGDAAASPPASGTHPIPRKLSERGQAVARRIADPIHADLFAGLTPHDIATAVTRIDGNLQQLEKAEWWPDIDAEVDSWVSYSRLKGEGRAWSPQSHLGAVEDLGRTRCRERPAKARIERERRRQEVARTGGVVELDVVSNETELASAERTWAKPAEPAPVITPEERKRQIAQLATRIGKAS